MHDSGIVVSNLLEMCLRIGPEVAHHSLGLLLLQRSLLKTWHTEISRRPWGWDTTSVPQKRCGRHWRKSWSIMSAVSTMVKVAMVPEIRHLVHEEEVAKHPAAEQHHKQMLLGNWIHKPHVFRTKSSRTCMRRFTTCQCRCLNVFSLLEGSRDLRRQAPHWQHSHVPRKWPAPVRTRRKIHVEGVVLQAVPLQAVPPQAAARQLVARQHVPLKAIALRARVLLKDIALLAHVFLKAIALQAPVLQGEQVSGAVPKAQQPVLVQMPQGPGARWFHDLTHSQKAARQCQQHVLLEPLVL